MAELELNIIYDYKNNIIGITNIGKKYGLSSSSVERILRKNNIRIRSHKEAVSLANKKHPRNQRGKENSNWKGGRIPNRNGYVLIYNEHHPHAIKRYVPEHRLVMEKHIGRILDKDERVHHINGDKHDNNIENLMLFKSDVEHNKYEKTRLYYLEKCIQDGTLIFKGDN